MIYQADRWAEATVAMWCVTHQDQIQSIALKLPPETWKTHVGNIFAAFVNLNASGGQLINLRQILNERTRKGHRESSIRVGWKVMLEEGMTTALMHPELIDAAINSMWQAHAESERAGRIEKLAALADTGNRSAYLAELDALMRLEKSGNPSLLTPEAETMEELNQAELQTAESILGEGLLNQSGLMWIHAPDGTGKTLLALQLASSIALGRPWLDQYDTRAGKVLYLQGELSRPWWQKRTRDLQEYENGRANTTSEDSTIVDGITFCHTRFPLARTIRQGKWIEIVDVSGMSTLEAMIAEHKVDVVFIDPLTKFYDLKENSTEQNREFMNRLLDLRRSTNITIILVHHDRKMDRGGDNEGQEMRGSGVLRGDADTSVRLQSITKKDRGRSFPATETFLVWEKLRHAANPGKLKLMRADDSPFFEKWAYKSGGGFE